MENRVRQALTRVLPDADPGTVQVQPCPDPRFGDYQVNAMMALAKARKLNPRQLATDLLSHLDVADGCEPPTVAGAGFLNFRLKPAAIAGVLEAAARGEHLFFVPAEKPRVIVVDFSSPNVAKAMHVGHIRSTILGDSLARIFRLLGHRVITDNHIGDWGTQFGKLLVGWKQHLDRSALERDSLAEMERLYRLINAECEKNPALLDLARQELLKLQQGDPENRSIWQEMIDDSRHQFDTIYDRLGVRFDQTLGESFYNPRLNALIDELNRRGIAEESDGARVVFFPDHPELKQHPAIVLKRDGAANYTTTDLATLAHRLETWQPNEIVYVTDGRQQLHFKQLFAVFRRWQPEARVTLAHVWFGSILGEDGKPFKTRSGEVIRLSDLLDEAEDRAFKVVSEKNPDLAEAVRREIARTVGLGALKYADLLPNRQGDYVFSWDRMLALNGNTAPYLQYAYTRIRSIFRKSGFTPEQLAAAPAFVLAESDELALAKQLLNFGLVLEGAAREYRPNFLCNYLYDLAGLFARFYENCPVLKAEEPARSTRLALCELTARVLREGLDTLGIETPEQM
ncbi:MAG: arginine--tRNA ligase [Verrucomicrobia bacterium]|nr:arginine--tRNA ligase [Verrucomicrobiota bacterium]